MKQHKRISAKLPNELYDALLKKSKEENRSIHWLTIEALKQITANEKKENPSQILS